jgi:hypothetical protein
MEINLTQPLFFLAPGAVIAFFRSFAIRGKFPSIGLEDLGVVLLGATIYTLCIRVFGLDISEKRIFEAISSGIWFLVLFIIPAAVGTGIGLIEANDVVGRSFRTLRIRLPSPDSTAWETMFRELPTGSVLIVTLRDGSQIAGRWMINSASSDDEKWHDIYIAEIGEDVGGHYIPSTPIRGAYVSADEIKLIEVIRL